MQNKSDISLERVIQVWDDKTGARVEFGPDRDGLGLWELRNIDEKGNRGAEVVLHRNEAILLFTAALAELKREQAAEEKQNEGMLTG